MDRGNSINQNNTKFIIQTKLYTWLINNFGRRSMCVFFRPHFINIHTNTNPNTHIKYTNIRRSQCTMQLMHSLYISTKSTTHRWSDACWQQFCSLHFCVIRILFDLTCRTDLSAANMQCAEHNLSTCAQQNRVNICMGAPHSRRALWQRARIVKIYSLAFYLLMCKRFFVCLCRHFVPSAISLLADFNFFFFRSVLLIIIFCRFHDTNIEYRYIIYMYLYLHTKYYKMPWQCDKCAVDISDTYSIGVQYTYTDTRTSYVVRLLCNCTQLSSTLLYHFTCLHVNFLSVNERWQYAHANKATTSTNGNEP